MNKEITHLPKELNYLNYANPIVDKINVFDAYLVEDSLKTGKRYTNPILLSWNIMNNRNINFIYCTNDIGNISSDEMEFKNIIKKILNFKKIEVKHIRLLEGEPSFIEILMT